jgi:precorrin-6A/cobalt-precorrin-6A reductase
VCGQRGIPYLTFVRPPAAAEAGGVLGAGDHEEAARVAFSFGAPVLLTTGSRNLAPYVREARRTGLGLTVRVLDCPESLAACGEAGVPEDRVLAGRGPFGLKENRTAIRHSQAGVLVTKDGGQAGGVQEKLEAARLEGCRVVLVRRPTVPAGNAFGTVADLVETLVDTLRPGGPGLGSSRGGA